MKKQQINYEEDLDHIDFNNYKGCFYNKNTDNKYLDEVTGSHFNYFDMCLKLELLKKRLNAERHLSKPKSALDFHLKATINKKLCKNVKVDKNPQKISQKKAVKIHSRNLLKLKTESSKEQKISDYFTLATKLKNKLAGQTTERNKSVSKSYQKTFVKTDKKTEITLRCEALFGQ